ncbi:hypothetical protein RRG08_003011 [Elysia crispata]|uniref:Uncharacterized protein n=1 Tax=Elysia crispata TaxID=231223 RepID=A0AAE1B4W4_9GAST|nr:hypothetical protein RRG08_003011 [Elysia crispata]
MKLFLYNFVAIRKWFSMILTAFRESTFRHHWNVRFGVPQGKFRPRQLKAALKARTTSPNWLDELPMVLLGIRSSWRACLRLDTPHARRVPTSSPRTTAFVAQFCNSEDSTPVNRSEESPPTASPTSGPSTVLPSSSSLPSESSVDLCGSRRCFY